LRVVNSRESELLTLAEAAAYLRVHRRTMGRLLRDGTVPGSKIGRQWRIRRADLDALLATTNRGRSPNGAPHATVSREESRITRAGLLVGGPLAGLLQAGLMLLT
jgi:excisionase family DNA binding protein